MPLADLSYRDYEGPLASPRYRWWVIAKATLRLAVKKRIYWVLTVLSGMYYLLMLAILFFMDQVAQNSDDAARFFASFIERIIWKDQFLHGFGFGQLWILMIVLLVGAGSIANDNRSNALLVYLSKPCSKLDYIFGKWFGVFLAIMLPITLPTAFFYMYGGLSYADYGFFGEKTVGLRLLVLIPFAAAFYTSFVVGISSLFNQGRLAGAACAAIYFLSNFFTQLMAGTWTAMHIDRGAMQDLSAVKPLVEKLYYASVDGLQIGMAKGLLDTNGTPYLGIRSRIPNVPAPNLSVILLLMALLSLAMLWLAWRRVRAVEVVR
jgi:ABC-2 type transport system permease protein